MGVHVSEVRVELDRTPILHGVDLDVAPGSTTGLIGPNGSGKSTLLRCLHRALRPSHGVVPLGDEEVGRMRAREVGRAVAVVAQDHDLDDDFTARETAAMGRTPHLGPLDRESRATATWWRRRWSGWAWCGPRTARSPPCPAASANASCRRAPPLRHGPANPHLPDLTPPPRTVTTNRAAFTRKDQRGLSNGGSPSSGSWARDLGTAGRPVRPPRHGRGRHAARPGPAPPGAGHRRLRRARHRGRLPGRRQRAPGPGRAVHRRSGARLRRGQGGRRHPRDPGRRLPPRGPHPPGRAPPHPLTARSRTPPARTAHATPALSTAPPRTPPARSTRQARAPR
ncbi:ATP-binding cassette domain-containing protein [Actinosynnema pretiosum subsp. pretiosum]|uniref:ATP-binding cassette domain-containing protein n=1 Tax=Actinosynnema pretiosum subsp. pretiosum TaxID=103721 RepID=A0AA45LE90_9PSEU|nr:ATP-binding cassette domain-containing protein [Actinosynnema pretiosum subsp. pretiosum]